ncbi:MAG: hypothetical protein M5R40_13710 [Anaerolineae bacterium]|nr:hypothetical protein [Anaerolineae bacterium]
MPSTAKIRAVVVVSANGEWAAVRDHFAGTDTSPVVTPYGACFVAGLNVGGQREPVVFLHGGWGKIAAAASAQYAIDRWQPAVLVNLGTCGGFEGEIARGEIVLAARTVVYDIIEQMVPQEVALAHYTTEIDLSWLGEDDPQPVRRTLLVSGDRDLVAEERPAQGDVRRGGGDWESGAIAWVAARNGVRLLILRGVTDLVGVGGSAAYGNVAYFNRAAREIMARLLEHLPAWLARAL